MRGGLNNQKWLLQLYLATAREHGLALAVPHLNMEFFEVWG